MNERSGAALASATFVSLSKLPILLHREKTKGTVVASPSTAAVAKRFFIVPVKRKRQELADHHVDIFDEETHRTNNRIHSRDLKSTTHNQSSSSDDFHFPHVCSISRHREKSFSLSPYYHFNDTKRTNHSFFDFLNMPNHHHQTQLVSRKRIYTKVCKALFIPKRVYETFFCY